MGRKQQWNAVVETDLRREAALDDEIGDAWTAALAAYHGTVGTSALNHYQVTVTVEAASVEEVTTRALGVVRDRTGREPVGLEVMTAAAFDRTAVPQPGYRDEIVPLVSADEAATIIGVSRQRVHELVEGGQLVHEKYGARGLAISRRSAERLAGQDRKPGRPAKVDG